MTYIGRFIAAVLLLCMGIRAAATIAVAYFDVPHRMAVYFSFTEPQMVHLSRQAQLGESLYPEWREYPHVVNVFTPGWFWIVGTIGKVTNASLEGVQWTGRGVTITFSLIAASLAAYSVRPLGRAAMFAAACATLASGTTWLFGWMARPDITADALGFAGFLAATSRRPPRIAVVLLAAGVLCKQTAALYVATAVVALFWEGRSLRATVCAVGSTLVVLAILGVVWWAGERRVFTDIFFEASSPWNLQHWKTVNLRFFRRAGDAIFLCLIGAIVWRGGLAHGGGERGVAIRWLTLLGFSATAAVVGSAKLGSDVNYFLPLRFVAAAALAEIVHRLCSPSVPLRWIATGGIATLAAAYWTLPNLVVLQRHPAFVKELREEFALREREVDSFASNHGTQRILTNCDDLALRVGNPFIDSFVFKMSVDDGRLHPTRIRDSILRGEYDWIVTTAEVNDANYIASTFGMPRELAAAIEQRYELAFRKTLAYYRRKG